MHHAHEKNTRPTATHGPGNEAEVLLHLLSQSPAGVVPGASMQSDLEKQLRSRKLSTTIGVCINHQQRCSIKVLNDRVMF